jgi:hypothetical protein
MRFILENLGHPNLPPALARPCTGGGYAGKPVGERKRGGEKRATEAAEEGSVIEFGVDPEPSKTP